MNHAKRVVHQVLRRFGADVVRYQKGYSHPLSFTSRRRRWLAQHGVTVVLDVGANTGQYAQQLRTHGYMGRIVSFEPLSSAFAELQRHTTDDLLWECRNCALGGAEAVLPLHVAGNSESSSLLPMCERHVAALASSAYVCDEPARVLPLDTLQHELLRQDDEVWLKLDVQGYELSVLDGAQQTLSQVKAIEMELSLAPLYEGAPLLCEAIRRLGELGFQLVAIEDAFVDTHCLYTLQLNGIFQRQQTHTGATLDA